MSLRAAAATTAAVLVVVLVFMSYPSPVDAEPTYGYLTSGSPRENTSICNVSPDTIQTPLFRKYNRAESGWWHNTVEEAAFSNVPFVALNIRGDSPCGGGNIGGTPPSHATDALNAINARGYGAFLKLALFDDCPAYTEYKNQCTGTHSFDLGDQQLWHDYFYAKWNSFFSRVPDGNRQKLQRSNGDLGALVITWSVSPFFGFHNHPNNLRQLIQYLRDQVAADFGGLKLFIVVDQSWVAEDPTVVSVIDGVNDWFNGVAGPSWTSRGFPNGCTGQPPACFETAVVVPGFWHWNGGNVMYIPRNGGQTLTDGLAATVTAELILLEGQTDVEENAGYYRGAMVPCPATCAVHGPPGGQNCWTRPNQYLNLVRAYSAPFPKYIVYEAEACDSYQSTPAWTTALFRRENGLATHWTNGAHTNWSVELGPTHWVEFSDFELGASSTYKWAYKASLLPGACTSELSLQIDGTEVSRSTVPSTGGWDTYVQVAVPGTFSISAGKHNIRLVRLPNPSCPDCMCVRVDWWLLDGF